MFKDFLLVVLVSVVWSLANATYLIDDGDDYGLLRDFGLASFPSTLFQTYIDAYSDDHHGIVLPHLSSPRQRYTQHSNNGFQSPIIHTSGFKPMPNHGSISASTIKGNQNENSYETGRINQQRIEIKSIDKDQKNYLPQSKTQGVYHRPELGTTFHGAVIGQHDQYGKLDFTKVIGQIQNGRNFNQNSQYVHPFQTKINDVKQQEYVDENDKPTYTQTSEPKSDENIKNKKSYTTDEEKYPSKDNSNQYNNNPNTSDYENIQNILLNSKLPTYHAYKPANKNYPLIYNRGSANYFVHNNQEYSLIPVNLRPNDGVLNLEDGIGYSSFGANGHVNQHGGPHLASLGEDTLYQIEHDNTGDLEDGIKLDLGSLTNYDNLRNNNPDYKSVKDVVSPTFTDSKPKIIQQNVEQKTVEIGLKSTDQPNSYDNIRGSVMEYKNINNGDTAKYPEMKTNIPVSNVEQKDINIGLESSSESKNSYHMTDVQQKSVEVDLKSSARNYELPSAFGAYDDKVNDNKPKYSASNKKTELNIEQKSAETSLKKTSDISKSYDGLGDSNEYDGIGSVDAPKYPEIKKKASDAKLEQKSVEIKNYQEVKSNIRSLKKDTSHGNSGSYVQQSTLGGSQQHPAGGIPSNTFRNIGVRNNNAYNPRVNSQIPVIILKYPLGQNVKYNAPGNKYFNSRHQIPVQRNRNNHAAIIPNPSGKFHRSSLDIANIPFSINYRKPSHIHPNLKVPISHPRGIHHRPSHIHPDLKTPISPPRRIHRRPSRIHPDLKAPISPPTAIYRKPSHIYPDLKVPISPPRGIHRRPSHIHANLKAPRVHHHGYTQHPSNYAKIGGSSTPTHFGVRNIPRAIPKYQENVSGSEYSPNIPARTQTHHAPATSFSYLTRGDAVSSKFDSKYPQANARRINTPSKVDYSSDIVSTEYPGIDKIPHSKPTGYSEVKPYTKSEKPKLPVTEQKPHKDELSDALLGDSNKPSTDEYSGIGEIGSTPVIKSEIVGGRYPIKLPLKSSSVKSVLNPSGIKGKSESKKYLPITAALSTKDLDPKPEAKSHGNIKNVDNKEPQKTEQQELGYEALLAGQGARSNGVGSSGFGFNRSPTVTSGIRGHPYGPTSRDENLPPMPYEFKFDIQDDEHGSEQYRQEKMDDNGYLTGRYGFKDAEGIFREVEYEASKDGFKVNRLRTNEPGTENQNPADVKFEVEKQR